MGIWDETGWLDDVFFCLFVNCKINWIKRKCMFHHHHLRTQLSIKHRGLREEYSLYRPIFVHLEENYYPLDHTVVVRFIVHSFIKLKQREENLSMFCFFALNSILRMSTEPRTFHFVSFENQHSLCGDV